MGKERRKDSKAARPVGHPGVPDPAATGKGELEERRAALAGLRDLAEKAQDGDEAAAVELRKMLDGRPDLAWRFIKGPGKMAEDALVGELTRDEDLAPRELLKHQLEPMRIEVAGENPSPLERLSRSRWWTRSRAILEPLGAGLCKILDANFREYLPSTHSSE